MKVLEIATEARALVADYEKRSEEATNEEEWKSLEPNPETVVAVLTALADHIEATAKPDEAATLPIKPRELIALTRKAKRYLVLRELFATVNGPVSFGRASNGILVYSFPDPEREWDGERVAAFMDSQCDEDIRRLEGTET